MSDDNVQQLPKGKTPKEIAFGKIKEEKLRQKQEEINKAVKEYVEAKKVCDNAAQKIMELEEERRDIEGSELGL